MRYLIVAADNPFMDDITSYSEKNDILMVIDELPSILDLRQAFRRHKGWWFRPDFERPGSLPVPSLVINGPRPKGSGWRRRCLLRCC